MSFKLVLRWQRGNLLGLRAEGAFFPGLELAPLLPSCKPLPLKSRLLMTACCYTLRVYPTAARGQSGTLYQFRVF
eukprot:5058317-Amphidinium_carterae.1